jgi:hypothetical protein
MLLYIVSPLRLNFLQIKFRQYNRFRVYGMRYLAQLLGYVPSQDWWLHGFVHNLKGVLCVKSGPTVNNVFFIVNIRVLCSLVIRANYLRKFRKSLQLSYNFICWFSINCILSWLFLAYIEFIHHRMLIYRICNLCLLRGVSNINSLRSCQILEKMNWFHVFLPSDAPIKSLFILAVSVSHKTFWCCFWTTDCGKVRFSSKKLQICQQILFTWYFMLLL